MHTLASDAHLRFVWTLDCQTANGFLWAEHTDGTRNARRRYNKEKDAGGVIVGLEHCQCQMGISSTTVIVRYPLCITRLSSQIPIDITYASCLFLFTDDSSSPICPKRRKRTSTSKSFFFLLLWYLSRRTVFENHRKSLIQHCERSKLCLHFEWTKVN